MSSGSRHFSWLLKSCFPNPHQPHHPSPLTAAAAAAAVTILSLPDDLLLECLSRVPQSTLPSLPSVCRHWAQLIDSAAFHLIRLRHQLLHHTLFAVSLSGSALFTAALRLDHAENCSWELSSFAPPDEIHGGGLRFDSLSHFRLVSIGRKIYIVGRSAMLRCDTWTGALVPKAGMSFPRKKFAAAAVAGRILIAGGCARSSAVEEYDPEADEWRVVSESPRRRYGCLGASADGVFYVIGGLRIGGDGASRAEALPHVYASSMDLYDVEAGTWLRSRAVPGGGCVVAACAAAGDVYVLSSHAVELSFWRFSAARANPSFGEWRRIKSPPLPAQVRLDSKVRFSCVGAGQRVVLVQVAGCIDDLLRRSGRAERGLREGLVLVYDCGGDEWNRAADMPELVRRAGCVCVEC